VVARGRARAPAATAASNAADRIEAPGLQRRHDIGVGPGDDGRGSDRVAQATAGATAR